MTRNDGSLDSESKISDLSSAGKGSDPTEVSVTTRRIPPPITQISDTRDDYSQSHSDDSESHETFVEVTHTAPAANVQPSYREEPSRVPSVRKHAKTVSDRRRLNVNQHSPPQIATKLSRIKAPVAPSQLALSGRSSSSDDEDEIAEKKKKREANVKRLEELDTELDNTPRIPTAVGAIDVDCEMGHRSYMEDALVALQDITSIGNNVHDLNPTAFFAVYDGHGGVQASRFVQKYLHLRLAENLEVNGQTDLKTSLISVIKKIDNDFLLRSGVPIEGIPPLLENNDVSKEIKKKPQKKKNSIPFKKGEYVDRMVKLQQERNILYRKLKSIPTTDGEIITVEGLVRDKSNFDRLDDASRNRWSRFLTRFSTAYPEFYEKVLTGEADFKKLQHLKTISGTSGLVWMDTVTLTSDDDAQVTNKTKDTENAATEVKNTDNITEVKNTENAETESKNTDNITDKKNMGIDPVDLSNDPMTKNPSTPGTTVCVCLVSNESIWTAWLGDSEAVLFRDGGTIVPLVHPHKPLRTDEVERITKLGGSVVTQFLPGLRRKCIGRVQGQLSVSRAVGDAHLKRWVTSDADVMKTPIDGTEEFLVMASDGLWDVLTFKEVYKLVRRFVTTDRKRVPPPTPVEDTSFRLGRTLSKNNDTDIASGETSAGKHRRVSYKPRVNQSHIKGAARYLIRTALSCGSTDNISVIIIFFKKGLDMNSAANGVVVSSGTTQQEAEPEPLGSRRALFSGVGLFNRARIRRVFARDRRNVP